MPNGLSAIFNHAPEKSFSETSLKRESSDQAEGQAIKRRRTPTSDEKQRSNNMTSQRANFERTEYTEGLPTECESVNSFSSASYVIANDIPGKTKYPPIDLLCRLFPTQKKSVLQLIYRGCNNDLIKTIESVLPSHEKAIAHLNYQSVSMDLSRCPQFISPGFPPMLPYPINQRHRSYISSNIASEPFPLYNIHGGAFRRDYVTNIGYHNKATCQEFTEDSFPVSKRTCPCCHKDVAFTSRACESCGHCFEVPPLQS